jgi:transcriptional regulator GlxA family with amidase domain
MPSRLRALECPVVFGHARNELHYPRELLARVRHAQALDYLRTTHLSMDDIGAALGFSDANSFRQAFRRWSGKSPTEFRP